MTDLADEYSTWDAAYVLGSLGAAERREFEAHLRDCPHCQNAVAELAGLPGMLALVDRDTALSMIESTEQGPPPDLLPSLAAAAAKRRRRTRWLGIGSAVAAVAATVAIAVPVTMTVARSDSPAEQVVAQQQMRAVEQTPITAEVKLVRDGDRTRLVMTCRYGGVDYGYGAAYDYGLVVTVDGQRMPLDQWPAGPGTELTVDRTIDAAPESIDAVEITSVDSGRTVLVAQV
ncbi:anti-sigma factor [Nocardia neocaledoniensis NBRC 108232]|uniref:Putative zinc finger protein n=1 Tax=Nocardia neocaledoniensis TaxID=236511 RepID=A0A317NLD1_9NOCA|nr:zf-HC2 domain-containing protein [Nocardia neocaledoniensis]PWV76099.1 putative zinc finger protein [Nocardia neocaledoniensis]GEM34207.1 anti-sigma factor [Nocardia neocaledoniensis NBRC 108232]